MKKILVMIISLIFLESCQTPPQEFKSTQCQPVFSYDSVGGIDVDRSFCRCRDYTISREFIGSRGNVVRKNLAACDQVLGYTIKENTRLVNFLQWVRIQITNEQEFHPEVSLHE